MILNIFKLKNDKKKKTQLLFWSSAMGGKLVEKSHAVELLKEKKRQKKYIKIRGAYGN